MKKIILIEGKQPIQKSASKPLCVLAAIMLIVLVFYTIILQGYIDENGTKHYNNLNMRYKKLALPVKNGY